MTILTIAALLSVVSWNLPAALAGEADAYLPIDLRNVRVGGELGRRIDITINNNLLVLDADHDFLAPFREKSQESGYIGLGKLLDATVKFLVATADGKCCQADRQ